MALLSYTAAYDMEPGFEEANGCGGDDDVEELRALREYCAGTTTEGADTLAFITPHDARDPPPMETAAIKAMRMGAVPYPYGSMQELWTGTCRNIIGTVAHEYSHLAYLTGIISAGVKRPYVFVPRVFHIGERAIAASSSSSSSVRMLDSTARELADATFQITTAISRFVALLAARAVGLVITCNYAHTPCANSNSVFYLVRTASTNILTGLQDEPRQVEDQCAWHVVRAMSCESGCAPEQFKHEVTALARIVDRAILDTLLDSEEQHANRLHADPANRYVSLPFVYAGWAEALAAGWIQIKSLVESTRFFKSTAFVEPKVDYRCVFERIDEPVSIIRARLHKCIPQADVPMGDCVDVHTGVAGMGILADLGNGTPVGLSVSMAHRVLNSVILDAILNTDSLDFTPRDALGALVKHGMALIRYSDDDPLDAWDRHVRMTLDPGYHDMQARIKFALGHARELALFHGIGANAGIRHADEYHIPEDESGSCPDTRKRKTFPGRNNDRDMDDGSDSDDAMVM